MIGEEMAFLFFTQTLLEGGHCGFAFNNARFTVFFWQLNSKSGMAEAFGACDDILKSLCSTMNVLR